MKRKKNIIYFFIFIFFIISCSSISNKKENNKYLPPIIKWRKINPNKLTIEQRIKLKKSLEVFYTNNRKKWEKAKRYIFSLGYEGIDAFCIFMIKFFFMGKKRQGEFINLDEIWKKARKELAQLKEKAVPYLIYAMSDPKIGSMGRLQCSITLVDIGEPAIEPLIENLERGSHAFRRAVIETLGNIGDKRVLKPICNLYEKLKKPNFKIELPEDLDKDYTYDIRLYCIKALSKLIYKENLKTLEKALNDPNYLVLRETLEALTHYCKFKEALPILKKAIKITSYRFIKYQNKLKKCINLIKSQ